MTTDAMEQVWQGGQDSMELTFPSVSRGSRAPSAWTCVPWEPLSLPGTLSPHASASHQQPEEITSIHLNAA